MGQPVPETQTSIEPGAGGSRELLRLAAPLILSSSFFTVQMTVDRVMLSHQSSQAVAAAMSAGVLYWTLLALLQQTAAYVSTFVAQYVGAGRPERVGPAVWQAIYFSIFAGLAFLLLIPLLRPFLEWTSRDPELMELKYQYLFCLCFATLPFLLVASINGFFSGRGDTWRVLLIDGSGAVVAVILCYAWIDGNLGFPAWGIVGAGWAVVCGNWAAVAVGLTMMLQPRFRREFATLRGWRPDFGLFGRLMRFGLPGGLQYSLEALAFTVFLIQVELIGRSELSATSIAFTINMTALVPMLGLAQAVAVLVGQRLGQNRPDIAVKTAVRGVGWCLMYTAIAAVVFLTIPHILARQFSNDDAQRWAEVEPLIPLLLKFVALYCMFESVSLIVSSALRGAGDTRFVSAVTLIFSWSIMVVPTIIASQLGGGLVPVWICATTYLMILSGVFVWRFRQGRWKSMRVIEAAPVHV